MKCTVTKKKEERTTTYELTKGWKINLCDKVDILDNKDGKVAVILKSKNFGNIEPIVIDLSEDAIRIHSLPHFVDSLSFTLDKKIEIVYSPFIFEQEQQ